MLSMTGFGSGAASDQHGALTVQIVAVNHRGCQVQVRGDLRDLELEERLRQEARTALGRGAITIQVRLRPVAAAPVASGDAPLAAAWRELARLAHELGAPTPTLEGVAAMLRERTGAGPADSDREELVRSVSTAMAAALADLQRARRREGDALAAAFARQAKALRALLPALCEAAAARLAGYRETLLARLREVLAGQAAIGEEHLVRELALHSDRLDVTEELVRLASHLDALNALIAAGDDQLGRKLEFLLQEISREVTTAGAKSNDLRLTNLVLEAKALVEQMREQAANVL
jgi:uncharacterized protein (TIGR00255 family)